MRLSPSQRLQLIQWITALPAGQFEELLFALAPPPGNISASSEKQGIRAGELLTWAESPFGPGIAVVIELLRTFVERLGDEKLTEFDAGFWGMATAG
jgi:hypothetical protein